MRGTIAGWSAIPRKFRIIIGAIVAAILLLVLLLAAFPVTLLRGLAERQLAQEFDAPVTIGGLSRDSLLSFTPNITVSDARIGQPEWAKTEAGEGDFLTIKRASAQVPILSLLSGSPDIRALHISGLTLALVRDADGRGNWEGRPGEEGDGGRRPQLEQLTITDSRFSLRDAKRHLDIAGDLQADAQGGLRIHADGQFDGAPASLAFKGAALAGAKAGAAWPFTAQLDGDRLALTARGTMAGALNFGDMKLALTARAPSLTQLDYIIEAGLFGTQDIDISGDVRHQGEDWFIDRLEGTIGRSQLRAKAIVRKRDGRTKIDARIDASQLDFDDLADDEGLAKARAKEARIGKRIIPDVRVNLSKMGPTDGVIHFAIERLLVKGGSAFRSLKGRLELDHRVLKLTNAVAGLESGQVTGWLTVDSTGEVPLISTELRVTGTSLDTLIGRPDMIRGRLDGLVRINGHGDTIRDGFTSGSGKIAFVARSGAMNRMAAFVLGQDLGGAISQKLGDDDAMAPIRCAILAFTARSGVLTPAPLAIATDISSGRGRGQINLTGETIALTLNGTAREKAALRLVDPIRVGGTLTSPAISLDQAEAREGRSGGGVIGAITRSIGSALGLRKDEEEPAVTPPSSVDCAGLARAALA
ncbi:AsmA family protein [Altererythrobacter xixiisoli]|uniref:AsmA family protein n=1 Tax=Croceibacterium xixiisoli TaxID=1476466 RepID=A0A6I4TZ65_9SPHN|nr:AsmA family protein [Croceibacterium xixiisoli]MXP00611.1 AsmA family protein [Croceibacterium xixiisoli]